MDAEVQINGGTVETGAKELVSVIIPVYKVEKYLSKCVESVLNQTYHNLQIILVPYKIDVVLQPHYPETLLHITRTKILPCKLIAQEYSVSSYENGSSSSSIWQA